MAINTLSRFGVPGLGQNERSPVIQPIFSNRWRVLFYGFGDYENRAVYDLTRQIQTIDLPKLNFDTHTLWSYLSAVYVTSRAEWDTITVTFLDDITNSVRTKIERQAAKQQNFRDVTAARAAENYKFHMDISVLAGGGSATSQNDPNVLRTYCLAGCYLASYDDNNLDYTNAAPKTVSVTIRPDNVMVFDHNSEEMIRGMSHTEEINGRHGVLSTGIGLGTTSSTGLSFNNILSF